MSSLVKLIETDQKITFKVYTNKKGSAKYIKIPPGTIKKFGAHGHHHESGPGEIFLIVKEDKIKDE